MAIESEEILSKISDLIESKVDELSTNLNNFRKEASNNNQTLENAIGSIKSVIDEKLSKIDQISSEINSIQTSVQNVADNVSATNNKIDNILSQQTQLQRTVDSVSQNIEKLSTVTSNQLTYLSNQSQNITEKVDKLSLQQEREARTAAVEGARGTVVVDSATGKTVSGVAAADATGDGEETKQSLIGSVLSGIKSILTSPLALGGAALGAAALGTAAALRKEPPGTPQAGSDEEFNLLRDTSGSRRTGGQTDQGPSLSPSGTTPSSGEYSGSLARDRKAAFEKELENPAVIRRLYNLSRTEVGKNPINQQLFSETVFNRSMFTGRSLSSTMSSVRSEGVRGGYYPVIKNYNPSPEELERFKQSVINKTISGANNTSMATDNASLDVARRRMQAGAHGQYLGVGKKDITREYYYSGGRGAGRYRTKHGIRAQEYQRRIEQERQQQSRQETETAPQPDARREPPQEQGRQFPSQRKLSGVNEEVTSRFNELQQFVGPLKVISGYRSPSYNRRVGGAKKSQHTSGNAIDIDVSHLSIEQRQDLIKYASALGYRGIGVYPNSIHLDMSSRRYWGPNYSGNSLPGWARRVIRSHMSNRFNRGDLPEQQRERQRQPDAKKQPDPDVSQPGTDKASVTTGDILRSLIPEAKASQNESVFRDEEDQFMRTYYPSDADPTQYQGMDDEDYEPDGPDLTGVPDFLKGFYKATGMPEGEDIEGRIEKKQPLLNFRGILREPSALGRMLGYERYVDENKMKELMKQAKMLQSMDDADLTPRKTKSEMEEYLNDILERARKVEEEAKKQAQQAQPQSQKVLGNLTGSEFFDPRTLAKFDNENKPGTGVDKAPRPKHKIKLNQYIDPDTLIQEI